MSIELELRVLLEVLEEVTDTWRLIGCMRVQPPIGVAPATCTARGVEVSVMETFTSKRRR